MTETATIFSRIQTAVLQIIPDAEVSLFGSRANGAATAESDWDILILSALPVSRQLKNKIQESLFPLSVDIAAFINIVLVNKDEWQQNPAYYSLRKNLMYERQAGSH